MITCGPKTPDTRRSHPSMRQVALVVACLVWGAAAIPEPPVPPGQYGAPSGQQGGYPGANSNGGYGDNDDYEDANYEFKYDVEDQESASNFGHQEARQGDVAVGRYYVLLPDGRTQTVEYTADQDGYHPKVTYQDPRDQSGYGSGGQGGYSSGGGAGYSSASGGRNGYSSGGGGAGYSSASGGQNGYSSGGQSGYSSGSTGVGAYSGSSGASASGGYSR